MLLTNILFIQIIFAVTIEINCMVIGCVLCLFHTADTYKTKTDLSCPCRRCEIGIIVCVLVLGLSVFESSKLLSNKTPKKALMRQCVCESVNDSFGIARRSSLVPHRSTGPLPPALQPLHPRNQSARAVSEPTNRMSRDA